MPILRKLRWGIVHSQEFKASLGSIAREKGKSYIDICIMVYKWKQGILPEKQGSELGVGSRSPFCGGSSTPSQSWQQIQLSSHLSDECQGFLLKRGVPINTGILPVCSYLHAFLKNGNWEKTICF